MNYCCTTCKKDFKQKSNLLSHLRRKKPCLHIITDITTSIIESPQKTTKSPQKTTKSPQKTTKEEKEIEDKLICEYCKKKYSRIDALNRHKMNYCKKKSNKIEELTEENIRLKEELLLTKRKDKTILKIHNNTNIANNTNIEKQTNITINFGEEDIKRLTENEILTSLKSLSNCFQNFVKVIHLNDRLPEYSNILINNMRSEFGSIIEDGILVTKNKNKIITDLITLRLEDIEEISNDYQNRLSKREFSYIVDMIDFLKNSYIETEDVDGNIVKGEKTKVKKLKDIHKQLQYLFYDNRSIVQNNMKKIDKVNVA
jgi:hypothetical protein